MPHSNGSHSAKCPEQTVSTALESPSVTRAPISWLLNLLGTCHGSPVLCLHPDQDCQMEENKMKFPVELEFQINNSIDVSSYISAAYTQHLS